MNQPCTTIASGRTAVPTAGTPVQLASSSTPSVKVIITAGKNNTGNIYFGDSTVSASSSTPVGAYIVPGGSITLELNDLSKIWLDAEVSGELVTYTYITTFLVP
jgi:hypothetical protein